MEYRTLNMPVGEIAYVMHSGRDHAAGQDYWHLYHRIEGVAIWGTIIPCDSEDEAVEALRAAIESGEARKVAELAAA
jgi:hypothetical protein